MATNGALLHTMGHTMAKGLLFLVSGNLLSAWHSKQIHEVRGALRHRPATGLLWLVGLFLVTGMPPSPLFVSELAILKGALDGGRTVLAIAYLAGMTVVFIGMAAAFLPMVLGERPSVTTRPGDDGRARRDTAWLIGPPAFLAVLAVSMGLGLPNVVTRCLADAAALVAGGAP
jgi:hydrogenase-4 component F